MKHYPIIFSNSTGIPNPECKTPKRIITFSEWLLAHYADKYRLALINGILLGNVSTCLCNSRNIISADAVINSLRFYRRSEDSINVDTILKCEIEYYAEDYYDITEESCTLDFRIRGYYDFQNRQEHLFETIALYDKADDLNLPLLNDYLYTPLRTNQLENEAYRILETFYSGDYMNGEAIDPNTLADCLDLTIASGNVSAPKRALGRLYIPSGSAKGVYGGQMSFFEVPKRTIVIDKITEANDTNRANNTIVHECVHYIRHSLFILLQEKYRNELKQYRPDFDIDNSPLSKAEQAVVKEIEWQAERLAPRIQMPEFSVRPFIEDCLSEFKNLQKTDRILRTIRRISNHFNVSLQAAKFRLCELGYTDASGVLNYIAGKRVPDYNITGTIEPYQTFTVEPRAIEMLCSSNKKFNSYIISRRLVYAEGHVCINHPTYIDSGNTPRLTFYARNNLDKCCVLFTLHRRITYSYKSGTLQRSDDGGFIEIEYSDAQILQMFAEADNSDDLLNHDKLSDEFSVSLREHMKRTKTTIERLSEASYISEDKIKKLRNSEGYKVTVEEIMAMGIAMHLYPALIYDLMEKAGVSLRHSKRHNYYRTIIDRMYGATIEQCNKALELKGMEPFIQENP